MHYVYVMRSLADDGFYIGYTRDLRKRFAQHTKGTAVATARRRPWKLIYYEAYIEQADAIGRERYLKKGSNLWPGKPLPALGAFQPIKAHRVAG